MNYCVSCGSLIPEGQGNSCSMCYGDIHYGKDEYYLKWAEQQNENPRYVCEEPPPHKDDF